MAVTAAQVKELREKTGAGIMDAKRALVETDGNMEAAAELLREKGIAKAAKKADRVAAVRLHQGRRSRIQADGRGVCHGSGIACGLFRGRHLLCAVGHLR